MQYTIFLLKNKQGTNKHINIFYRALLALRQCLPDQLRDNTFATCLQEDASTKHWLNQLLKNLETGPQPGPPAQPGQQDPRTIGMSPLAS